MFVLLAGLYVQTSYQLINALNVAKNYLKLDGCILFLQQYNPTDVVVNVTLKDGFIKGVYYTKKFEKSSSIKEHWIRLRGILTGNCSPLYTTFCCYHRTLPYKMPRFAAIICNKFDVNLVDLYKKIYNSQCKVYIIEDGVGDYVYDYSHLGKGYQRIYYWADYYNKEYNGLALNAPKISMRNIEFINLLSNSFNISSETKERFNEIKCIYFHQPIDTSTLGNKEKEEMILFETELLSLLQRKFEDGFFLKLHPRDDVSLFPQFKKIDNDLPWEVVLSNIEDVSDLVLVGLFSTTLITPKLVFDIEPKVLILEKVWKYWNSNESDDDYRLDKFFEEFKTLYNDKEKVYIPHKRSEIINYLESL